MLPFLRLINLEARLHQASPAGAETGVNSGFFGKLGPRNQFAYGYRFFRSLFHVYPFCFRFFVTA